MEIFSWQFLWFIVLASLILVFVIRRKKVPVLIPRKTISIQGEKCVTFLRKNTPLPCLLADGKHFGEDFKNKESLILPHGKGCPCRSVPIRHDNARWFQRDKQESETRDTDLGPLSFNEYRYYKYRLIVAHSELDSQKRTDYEHLADQIEVAEPFRQRVTTHLSPNTYSSR